MKSHQMNCLAAMMLGGLIAAEVFAQTTGFTYQGRLSEDGLPTTGLYNLRFELFDAETDGFSLGTNTYPATEVLNGMFTVSLDFGAEVFDGSDRWLEIGVVTNGGGALITLSPRQPITPAPYAIKANTATTVDMGTISDPWFIGTTTDTPLELNVNNTVGLRIEYPSSGTVPNLIGGFSGNSIGSGTEGAVIAGGISNILSGDFVAISGGSENTATETYSAVGGGRRNSATGIGAFIGGGARNTASGVRSLVGGGWSNTATNLNATVAGGSQNMAFGDRATIGGGLENTADGDQAIVAGGHLNRATNHYTTVGGGQANVAGGYATTVSGGSANMAANEYATVGGGLENLADGAHATVGGGWLNIATNSNCFVGGGRFNIASGWSSTVAGGNSNTASGGLAAVGGGAVNSASGQRAYVGGGRHNNATMNGSAILGGYFNSVSNEYACVGGGTNNLASGWAATVPGGCNNIAAGENSFAAGYRAVALHPGSFVWADVSLGSPFTSTATNQVSFRCRGGVLFAGGDDTNANQTVTWVPGAGSWSFSSDRNLKEGFTVVDSQRVLNSLTRLPITEWNYIGYSQRHIGPAAQDFHALFPLNENDLVLNDADLHGVALAAIQGLNEKVQVNRRNIEADIEELQAENETLKRELRELKKIVLAMNLKMNRGEP